MRASSTWTCAGLGLALLVISGEAGAAVDISQGVPNSLNQCIYCHTQGGLGLQDLNDFGSEFTGVERDANSSRASSTTLRWMQGVYSGDSDGDTKSNGLELGDPCGTGEAERTDDISDPSLATSTTTAEMPAEGCPAPGGDSVGAGPATPPPPFTSGICSVQGPLGAGSTLPVWAGLGTAAALGLGFWRARRRRR